MPNIMIIGFLQLEAERVQKAIDDVMEKLGKTEDSVTTIVEAQVKWCSSLKHAPYVLVRHSVRKEAKKIAEAINRSANLDVEYEKIDGFLPAPSSG